MSAKEKLRSYLKDNRMDMCLFAATCDLSEPTVYAIYHKGKVGPLACMKVWIYTKKNLDLGVRYKGRLVYKNKLYDEAYQSNCSMVCDKWKKFILSKQTRTEIC